MMQKTQCKLGDEFHLVAILGFIITSRSLPYAGISHMACPCFLASLEKSCVDYSFRFT